MQHQSITHYPTLPFRMVVTGNSNSGKTHFIIQLLLRWNELYPDQPLRRIIVVYSYFQPLYMKLQERYGDKCIFTKRLTPDLITRQGMGDAADGVGFLLMDDVMSEICSSDALMQCYSGAAHHLNFCCVLVTQNIFASRHINYLTAMKNATCMILFKQPRDAQAIGILGRQIFPFRNGSLAFQEAFDRATYSKPYGFLLLNLENECPSEYRLRSGLFPEEEKSIYSILK